MPRSTTVLVTSVLAVLLAAGALATRTSRAADECLSKPNATAPRGSHWYYRIDRPTQRRCWYLGAEGERTRTRRAALAAAQSDAGKARLRAQTDEAQRLGVFGAPSFTTADGELFWGNDRLEAALRWARRPPRANSE